MNKYNNPRVADTYVKKVKPSFSTQINEQWVDFDKILGAIKFHIAQKIGENVELNVEPLSESVFEIKTANMYNVPAFNSIVLEDSGAYWKDNKLCVEFQWKYTEKSGRVIKGDTFTRLEIDASGNILKSL